MTDNITYTEYAQSDFESLLKMGLKLWKDYEESELQRELEHICISVTQKIIIAKIKQNENIGFSIFSIRSDYVEGAKKRPTGYLEGIYVEPEYRNHGIAKEFLQLGEKWLKKNHCAQIGSDTWLTDKESRKFHAKMGFWEEDELVHFLKELD